MEASVLAVEAAVVGPLPSRPSNAGVEDESLPDEFGWDVRTYREDVEQNGGFHAELTWTLHQGGGRARLTVQVRGNPPGQDFRFLSWLNDDWLDNVLYDVEWSWPSPVTTTFLGEQMGPRAFRFITEASGESPFFAPTVRLDCETKGVAVHPRGAAQAVRYFYLPGPPRKAGFKRARVRWVPASTDFVSASVCTGTWGGPPDKAPVSGTPWRPLVFVVPTATSSGVEGLWPDELRWISPRTKPAADAPVPRSAGPVDPSGAAPTELDPGERTYRELVFKGHRGDSAAFRRVTFTLHGGPRPTLLVRREKPVPRGEKPFWTFHPEEEEYSWVPEAMTRYVATRRQDGDIELTAQGSTSAPSVLRLSCRAEEVAVRPAGAEAVAHFIDMPVSFEAGPASPLPAAHWSWEPPDVEVATAFVCVRTGPAWAASPGDASAPQAPPSTERPLVFVAQTSRASGVEWTDRGDGVGGALRWTARGR